MSNLQRITRVLITHQHLTPKSDAQLLHAYVKSRRMFPDILQNIKWSGFLEGFDPELATYLSQTDREHFCVDDHYDYGKAIADLQTYGDLAKDLRRDYRTYARAMWSPCYTATIPIRRWFYPNGRHLSMLSQNLLTLERLHNGIFVKQYPYSEIYNYLFDYQRTRAPRFNTEVVDKVFCQVYELMSLTMEKRASDKEMELSYNLLQDKIIRAHAQIIHNIKYLEAQASMRKVMLVFGFLCLIVYGGSDSGWYYTIRPAQ